MPQATISHADVNFATSAGRQDSELEDWLDSVIYKEMIQNVYRVNISSAKFRSRKKWSVRMAEAFKTQGKQWNDQIQADLKWRIAELVAASPDKAIRADSQPTFRSLVESLEQRLEEGGWAAPSTQRPL